MQSQPGTPDLDELIDLFYEQPARLGLFEETSAEALPPEARALLAHQNHMTVTVEQFHHSPVDVQVLATLLSGRHYARKILLRRQSDGRVVQFGIVRLDFACVSDAVRQEVESQSRPLGRILIEHNVLREVHLSKLWRIAPRADLCQLFELTRPTTVFGRTAIIDVDGTPAVELLEIVTPVGG